MKIEINPRSLSNLKDIFEILYKLHPTILEGFVSLQRILNFTELDKLTPEDREKIKKEYTKPFTKEVRDQEDKYLRLDINEYIPMKIYVEIEDPVVGKKISDLVNTLERIVCIDQFLLDKEEDDLIAYFAGGYGLTMNEEQKKKYDDFVKNESL